MNRSLQVDELVFDWNDFQQYVFQILRNIILDANPAITESVKYKVPFYTLNGLLMYVSPVKDGTLYLSFCQGDQMLDPSGLFASDDAKKVRKIYFTPDEEIDWETITAYIFEAVEINLKERSFSRKKKSPTENSAGLLRKL